MVKEKTNFRKHVFLANFKFQDAQTVKITIRFVINVRTDIMLIIQILVKNVQIIVLNVIMQIHVIDVLKVLH